MLDFGVLQSTDGYWRAELFVRANGTYGFRVMHFDANEQAWKPAEQHASESVLDSERAAIDEAVMRFPQLDPQTYRHYQDPAEMESATATRTRGVFATLGALGLFAGAGLLYFDFKIAGVVVLSLGALGLGWSMGGNGSSGYGGSNS